jgi:beta-lactamase class A
VNRRRFLISLAATSAALCVPVAHAADEHYDVSYIWTGERSEALDYLTHLKGMLGVEVSTHLELVLNADGLYGVVYNLRRGSKADATALATRHDAILREALGGDDALALRLPDTAYVRLYNVSYGLGPNVEELKQRYNVVSRALGAGVTSRLFIERTDRGNYALVYKRYGDLSSTRDIATRHTRLLSEYGVQASFIQERNNAIVFGATSQGAPPPPEPEPVADAVAEPEPKRARSARRRKRDEAEAWALLKSDINSHIQGHRQAGRVSRDEVTSWLVYDLKSDQLLASIHEDKARQCASMVKPFVALAFFHEAARGRFVYGPKSNAKFTAMIQHSSNSATNWVFEQLGGAAAMNRLLKKHYGNIFRETSIVENIVAGGRTYRNRASAGDYCRFLRALWMDELPYSSELKRLMNLPGRDRLYYGAPHIPVGTEIYNKTGSTSRLCGDMGILVARDGRGRSFPYVMVGIIEKSSRASNYSSWIYARGKIIRSVSDLVYLRLKDTNGLR